MKAVGFVWWGGLLALVTALGADRSPAPRGRPPLPPGTEVRRDVAYVPGGHEQQRLDLYVPAGKGPFPLVIWVHGGAWRAGNKAHCPALKLLAQGYAVASIEYRFSQHALWPAQIQDCKAAVRWLRAHAEEHRLDPRRFAAWGSSAGGHLVAMLGTAGDVKAFDVGPHLDQSSRVQAVVDFFGPTDFLQMDAHRLSGGMVHNRADSPESQLVGGDIREHPERVARANPITYVTADDPPFLIVHGDRDPLVPHHQSELLAAALRQAGVPARLYLVKGAGHGGFRDPRVPELVEAFLSKHLGTPAAAAAEPAWREAVEVYRRTPQTNLTMQLTFPPGWRATDHRPAVLFFFGGGWRNGTVEQFRPQAEHFARRGLVAARADYRVRSRHGVTPDACVEDARAALRWMRDQAGRLGVDPGRVIVAGGSAGGHLAACTALGDPDLPPPAALLLYNPVLDLRPLAGRPHVEGLDRATLEALSPIRFLTADAQLPPTVLFYGGDDLLRLQGRAFLDRADELGLPPPRFWLAPGQRHGFFNRGPWLPATTRLADAFLVEHGFLSGDSGLAEDPSAALRPVKAGADGAR